MKALSKCFILLFVISITVGNAQTIADTISLTTNFKGYQFIYKGEQIKAQQIFELMENNEIAWDEFNASREAYFFGNLFGILGSSLLIYPFIHSTIGNEPNYGPAFAGLCFIGISIPIFRSYNKKTISAIYLYNSGLKPPSNPAEGISLSLKNTKNGFGIVATF